MTDAEGSERITLPATAPRSRQSRMTAIATMIIVAVVLALGVAAYSVFTVAQDRNGWRDVAHKVEAQNDDLRAQVTTGNVEIACRSRANFNTVKATAEVLKIISELVATSGHPDQAPPIIAQLGPANAALDAAIAAQDAAIPDKPDAPSSCTNGG